MEVKIQKRFLQLYKNYFPFSNEIYEKIRAVSSQRPRMYGLPKIHKPNGTLIPILTMCSSVQHEEAK